MEKLYLFFGEAREGEINHYINDIGLQETKNRFIVYGEKILGVSDGRLNRDNTVVVLHSEWQSGKSLSQKTDEELYEDARWYLHAQRLSDGMRPYNETKITFGNWLAGLIVLPVYVSLSSDKPANDEKKPEITKKQAVDDRSQTNSMRKNDTPDDLLRWENVYVFISSTFNDMHAERDYLVKRVFPELRLWCEQRKLKLVDVDLRWGVTEADSVQNKRTVEVCLNSIDQCRPFFLCLLGQRRGWVPQRCEIAADTMDAFPGLADNLGHSMTELEIIHALMEPFREIPNDRNTVPQKCALLYCRKPDFLQEITSDSIKKIFTDDLHVTEISDWKRFVGDTIQTSVRECREYSAFWDKRLRTPELSFALTNGADDTAGRLSDFRCGKKVLAQQVIEDLKQAITDRFGEREIAGDHPLHKELDEQAMFLKAASEGFIEREDDFLAINRYIQSDDTRPFVIAAKAGIGKTSYLAHFIKTCDYKVYYRFIGKSDEANASETLALSLLDELACEHRIQGSVPRDPDTLLRVYPSLLAQAAQSGGFVIVIDALDQLSGGAETADFMLGSLPQGVKLIASIKQEGSQAYISRISGYAQVLDIRPFDSMEDRRRLVHAFLGSYLKKLDDNKMEVLLSAEETKNPLYLKVLLRELRVFGSHEGLMKVIRDHFGDTPVSAFSAVLARLEHDPAYCQVSMEALTENVFGWLCCTPSGLSVEELAQLLVRFGVAADRDAANDAVNLLFRQLRPYLAARGGRVGFFFESFKTACKQRYTLRKPEAKWHAELALYFSEQPISDPHRLLEQAYQYYHAGMTEALMAYLFSYRYMENKLARFDVERLVEDYAYYACESTGIMIGFLRICASVLRQDPIQLAGRLYGHLSGLDDAHCEKLLLDAKRTKAARGDAWLQPEFPCFRQPMGASIREYRTDSALGTDVNLILNDTHFVVGLGKHQIAVWCIDSDRIVKRIGTDACHVAAIKAAPDGTGFCALLVLDQSMHLKIWSSAGFQAICTIEIANYYRTTKYGSSCY
ncbi:MAG TPA: DUF4062 domain-containing protein, partial [Candidatus Limiplasma sp.]|nr:DUF4062 domain-containing protein [Candidatus Limiplasma sp.]